MDSENTDFLFKEYSDLLHYEGYTAEIKAEQPERYQFELEQFKNSHIVFPLILNF